MKLTRREMTRLLLAAGVVPPVLGAGEVPQAPAAAKGAWDVAVVGAGVFGAWSAFWLRKAGMRVILLDAYISAGTFVFACGPWLPKVFPGLLGTYIKPERAEVYFLGVAAGDRRFAPPQMPTWIYMGKDAEAYGMPVLENRGFKVAVDKLSLPADPDTMDREPTAPYLAQVREFVGQRFPALKDAPVVETRVCQYENTEAGNYLADRHPEMENVWLVGAGSGHGFRNGPAMGEYVANAIAHGAALEPMLTLGYKPKAGHRVD